MRIEQTRANVFTVTATSQELGVLIAAARMARDAMREAADPPPADAVSALERVLADYDHARARLASGEPGPAA